MADYLKDHAALARYVEYVESSGRPSVVSYSGAVGLMGIKPMTAAGPGTGVTPLRPSELYDPDKNRRFGEQYLAKMLNQFKGNVEHAILGYSMGPGATQKWIQSGADKSKLPPDKFNYVEGWSGRGPHVLPSDWKRYHEGKRSPAKPNPEAEAEINSLYSQGPTDGSRAMNEAVAREQAWSKANEFLDKSKP